MKNIRTRYFFAITAAATMAALGGPSHALCQSGLVTGEQKISQTEGGFTGSLLDDYEFGHSVASLGDLDGDGNTDLAVGTPLHDLAGPRRGLVWILFLTPEGTVRDHVQITQGHGGFTGALEDHDYFGSSVVCFGDLDGDGIQDLAAGAESDNDGGSRPGAVWILFMNGDGTVKGHQKISATEGGMGGVLDDFGEFGASLAAPGDINGDGLPDLVAGAPTTDNARGAVYSLLLNANGTVNSYSVISDPLGWILFLEVGDLFGSSVASVGDMDGDGIPDLAVGMPGDDDGGAFSGAAWIIFLHSGGSRKSEQKISPLIGGFTGDLDSDDRFGASVENIGDLDGDGVVDIAVGASRDGDGGRYRGAVWILYLDRTGHVKFHRKISSSSGQFDGPLDDSDLFGSSVCLVDAGGGAGTARIAVGAPQDDDGGVDRGAVWVLSIDGTVTPSATYRNDSGGTNTPGYAAWAPILGQPWWASVDNRGTGNLGAVIYAFATPAEIYLPGLGDYVLVNPVDPAGELLGLAAAYGAGQVTFTVVLPDDPDLCGFGMSTQGLGFGGGGITLHNAYDLVLGLN